MMEVPSLPSTPPQTTVLGALLAALVGLEVVVLWRALRRRRVIEEMLKAVEELEHRMVAGDESRAIVLAAYQKIRAILEAAGWEQTPQQTHREFLTGALDTLGVRTSHLAPFVELVDRAQYDPAPFDAHYRAQAHHLAILLGKVLRARLGRREAAG